MKIALYIEEGIEQIVLTPESKVEESILGKMHDGTRVMQILRGSFYRCHGGWTRQDQDDKSTMIVLTPDDATHPSGGDHHG